MSPRPLRLAGVNGLRALAAGAVLVYHVWRFEGENGGGAELGVLTPVMPHLWHGVTLFFVLSGFLLYRPFAAATLRRAEAPSIARYLRNRALRILPAYWVILLLTTFVLGTALVPDGAGPRAEGDLRGGLLLLNLLFLQNYSADTIFTGIGPAWSLSVEATFYVLLPLLALLAMAVARRYGHRLGAALAPVGALLALGASGKVASLTFVEWDVGVVQSIWVMADVLALGMLMAVAAVEVEDGRLRLPRWWRLAAVGGVGAVVVVAALTEASNLAPGAPATAATLAFTPAVGLACALLVALATMAGGRRGRFLRALESRPLALAGLVSYSAFLWHEPLLRWLAVQRLTVEGTGGFFLNVLLVSALTAVAATATYRLVEAPALRLKASGRSRRAFRPTLRAALTTDVVRLSAAALGVMLMAGVFASCAGGSSEPASQAPPAAEQRGRPAADRGEEPRPYRFSRQPGVTTASAFTDLGAEDLDRWEDDVPRAQDVSVGSSVGGEGQPALWLPPRRRDRPLVVVLHSWSNEYRQHIGIPFAEWAERQDWGMIAPNFQGANVRAEAAGSDRAVQDVVDAIDYAVEEGGVDRERVFVVGFSGGGMMSLLMAGRHPDRIAGAVSWVPVHDLADFHAYSAAAVPRRPYADQVEAACGADPATDADARESCERRSPSNWLERARRAEVPVYIGHGLSDDTVRPSAALRAFNGLADRDDRFGGGVIARVDGNELPDALRRDPDVPTHFAGGDPRVLYARRSANATLVLFAGEHDMVYNPGLEWMVGVANRRSTGG